MWLNSQKKPVKGHVEDHSAAELAYYRRVNESIILDPQRMNLIILKKKCFERRFIVHIRVRRVMEFLTPGVQNWLEFIAKMNASKAFF